MPTGGREVAGRQFRTRADYEAACRDKEKIDKLKQRYKLEEPDQLLELNKELQSRKYRFETMVGDDFIYEIEQAAKHTTVPSAKDKKKKKSVHKTEKKGNSKTKKNKSLEEYDKEMQKEILKQLSLREKRRKWIVIVCSLAAVISFGYYGVYYYFVDRTSSTYEQWADLKKESPSISGTSWRLQTEEETEEEREILDEYKVLYNKNKSLIGWVKIDDTLIDYPVMQTVNNEYYLTHNLEQEYDKNGSIFMDKDCDVLKPSTNLIIYGHHMKSGRMFGNLNKYSSKKYYEEHPMIQFDTLYEKGTYAIMYVFRSRVYNENEITFKYYQFIDANSAEEFNSNMEEMSKLSLYDTGVTAGYGDRLLTLSTCDSTEQDGRFVVVAKKVN
ncbi:MAG: class B sortase [Lachnospiraceae bacterium]|nr:class B sortase [Lachnospiraceae bacterium]